MSVEVVNASSESNWLTIGLAVRGDLPVSGSDGVGISPSTWGICDERDSSTDAIVASCGTRVGR